MSARHYNVAGMTCNNCVSHVREEVTAVPGVQEVIISLESGDMQVLSDGPIAFSMISEAVAEAGNYVVTEVEH